MATDHRGRGVHAGKRSDDEAYERSMRTAARVAAMRERMQAVPVLSNEPIPRMPASPPALDRGDAPKHLTRPPETMWDNPEYYND